MGKDKAGEAAWPNKDGGICPLCGVTCSRRAVDGMVEIECNDCTFNCLEEDFKTSQTAELRERLKELEEERDRLREEIKRITNLRCDRHDELEKSQRRPDR